ncbi:hypothetical protein N1031_07895 [Herbiconiux moechotypicola]|uniref:Uncharacterized protein n=1 Tax=Herbiconiux moechotypicola TaxID=637393 RepID=A0ABN3DI11_9MICO|nr:hypothetical protein [Herbiconiux moechotypicola]MCS5729681.1 hypothetical protein [Herbiconiux moechotypicola]
MQFGPGYGETPLEPDEADALTPQARAVFGDQPSKLEIYEAEQAINDEVSISLLTDVVAGELDIAALISDVFLRELHRGLYGDLWTWAEAGAEGCECPAGACEEVEAHVLAS